MSDHVEAVGFVGLGNLGLPMAQRLLTRSGALTVWTRSAAKAQTVGRSATVASSPGDVSRQSTVVVSCLYDDQAIEEVFLGPDGLLAAARPGQLFVEHGTFSPALAMRLARVAEERGAAFVDAPVTGGPEGVRQGTLRGMAGGEPDAVARAVQVTTPYCEVLRRIGGSGDGLRLKLVNQLLVTCHVAAAAEAISLLQALEIDLDAAAEILEHGWAGSAMLSRALVHSGAGTAERSGAPLVGLAALQGLIAELAATHGVATAVTETAGSVVTDAVHGGAGQADLGALSRFLGER